MNKKIDLKIIISTVEILTETFSVKLKDMNTPALEVSNLIKNYRDYRAVDCISFTVPHGKVIGLLGPNGAGKTTTIHMLLGITLPNGGSIRYFGKDFFKHSQECLGRINFASAYNSLQNYITVEENLHVFAGLYGIKNATVKIRKLLEQFEAADLGSKLYRNLSAGQKTRITLAKSLLNNPDLILMDEPTASLDPDIADKTLSIIESLRAEHELSILFTSHNMEEVTRICDEVIFLDRGKIVKQDTPTHLIKEITDVQLKIMFEGSSKKLENWIKERRLIAKLSSSSTVIIKTTEKSLAEIIAGLRHAGVNIVDIEIQKPKLEDVFLNIARGQNVNR